MRFDNYMSDGKVKKVVETTLGGDVAEPDTLIGDDPMRRRDKPMKKKKKKRKCLQDYLTANKE